MSFDLLTPLPVLLDFEITAQALHWVQIFGLLTGWLYITIAYYLQYNRTYDYPWQFPVLYFSMGLGILLIANASIVPLYFVSIMVTLIGYLLVAAVAINTAIWMVLVYPRRYAMTTDLDHQLSRPTDK